MTMTQCIENLSKDIEIIRNNQMEITKLKSRITEMKKKIHRRASAAYLRWWKKESMNQMREQ